MSHNSWLLGQTHALCFEPVHVVPLHKLRLPLCPACPCGLQQVSRQWCGLCVCARACVHASVLCVLYFVVCVWMYSRHCVYIHVCFMCITCICYCEFKWCTFGLSKILGIVNIVGTI